MSQPVTTLYEMAGGAETIQSLVTAFYYRVERHPDLAPIFPGDFTDIRSKQYDFLTQFFGGPPLYTQKYGSPMLRARHLKSPVTPKRAESWLHCMSEAMEEVGLMGPLRDTMFDRLTKAAYHMVNVDDGIPEDSGLLQPHSAQTKLDPSR